ncbi:MAG: hypothetical protein M0Z42_03115 [Actinomycetota bacterium]|nr:hypothetical protein [Actinomycetota bacterium]
MAPNRPRHPRPELEEICREVEQAGWRVVKGSAYFKAYCPCGLHKRSVHLTPSGKDYGKNLRQWFRRQPCWPKEH